MKLFVPGRICLLGEHSDWAGGYRRINADIEKGYSLITGTVKGIYGTNSKITRKISTLWRANSQKCSDTSPCKV